MNETLNTIKSRYSCRNYTGTAVSKEDLEAISLAAVQAPSAMNQQPWEIIVLTNKTLIDEMDSAIMDMLATQEDNALYTRMKNRGGKIFYNAPCMYIIAQKAGTDIDCGIICENIALAASSLGLGNVICKLAGLMFDTAKGREYKEKLIPVGYEFGVAVLIGHASDGQGIAHQVDMSKIKYID